MLSLPAAANAATVTLTWDANPESNLAGYTVVYGTSPGAYSTTIDIGNTISYSITGLTSGTRYYFAVRAYNTAGATGQPSNEVNEIAGATTPDTTPPTATVTGPSGGAQVGGSVAVSATAADNVAVVGVRFRVDGVAVGVEDTTAPYAYTWNTDGASNGSHTLTAVARDAAGNLGTSPVVTVQVMNDTTLPTATVTSPAAGAQLSASVVVSATATDNVAVAGVRFHVDGAAVGVEDTTAPYSYTWNTVGASNGSHALTAVARDTAGNLRTSAAVTVQVLNEPPPAGSGLVAAYGFDEGTGTVASDASGQGNTGTIAGAIWTPGRFGQSLEFDGVADWVTVAASGELNFSSAMTVEAWVYPTEAGGWRSVVFKEAPGEIRDHNYGLYSGFAAQGPGGHVLLDGFADNVKAHAPAVIVLNRWTHVATTYDGSVLRAYVDGVERAAVAATGPINVTAGVLRIGGNSIYGDFFKGQIDEVRLYNRALSPAEIATDMSTPIGTPPAGDTTPPTTAITAPAAGSQVSGSVAVSATATDNVAVAGVTFRVDGVAAGAEDTTAPYAYTWNTVSASNGSHALTAVARDTAGNLRTSAVVTVQVSNTTTPPPPVGSGLVAAYGFDEGTGTVTADASGQGNPGTITGAIWKPGRFGQSLEFDGSTDWVTVAANNAVNFTATMTVEAWIYPTEAAGWRSVVFKEAPGEIRDHNYGLYSAFGAEGPGGHVLLEGFADNIKAHASAAIVLNRWTHVATTYDGSVLRAYVDGVERSAVAATGPINMSPGVLRLGGNSMYGDFFKGQIDEVRLYNRALSPAEIGADMSTPIDSGLVAAYGFDEGAGTTTVDASGHGNGGVITGAAWRAGKFGRSLGFDGVSDLVTIAASASVNVTTAITVEAWVYPTEAANWRTILFKEAPGQANGHSYALYSAFGAEGPGGHVLVANQVNAHDPAALVLSRWTHVAMTYDGSRIRSYVDGVERASAAAAGPINLSNGVLRIGGNAIWGDYFTGRIDEVRLYNRALSAAEILEDMTVPVTPGGQP